MRSLITLITLSILSIWSEPLRAEFPAPPHGGFNNGFGGGMGGFGGGMGGFGGGFGGGMGGGGGQSAEKKPNPAVEEMKKNAEKLMKEATDQSNKAINAIQQMKLPEAQEDTPDYSEQLKENAANFTTYDFEASQSQKTGEADPVLPSAKTINATSQLVQEQFRTIAAGFANAPKTPVVTKISNDEAYQNTMGSVDRNPLASALAAESPTSSGKGPDLADKPGAHAGARSETPYNSPF